MSLYKHLITDRVWSYQRDNYGYRNLRSFPLLVSFIGIPYIDVRVSFNSFVPKEINDKLAAKLIKYYLDCLRSNKGFHDKVEFDIILSCYCLDIDEKLHRLNDAGFSHEQTEELKK
ncbi:unnamed protein product, partial [marine sediment metagenome]